MHGFDLEQLRTLVAAVEAGSLTAAAPRRHLSQSAVSEQLRKLEARAGRSLLSRSKAGVVPTEAGARLVAHARALLALSDAAWRDLHGVPLAGALRLAITDYFRPGEIAGWLARIAARHPGLRLHVHIDRSDAIEQGHARGDSDVAVVMQVGGGASSPAGSVALGREPLAWAGTAGTVLRPGEPLPLVALPEACALRRLSVSLLEQRRVPYYIALVASGVAGVQSAVAAGLGVACLNASALGGPVVALHAARRLPALPQAAFRILPARAGETASASPMRDLVRDTFRPGAEARA